MKLEAKNLSEGHIGKRMRFGKEGQFEEEVRGVAMRPDRVHVTIAPLVPGEPDRILDLDSDDEVEILEASDVEPGNKS